MYNIQVLLWVHRPTNIKVGRLCQSLSERQAVRYWHQWEVGHRVKAAEPQNWSRFRLFFCPKKPIQNNDCVVEKKSSPTLHQEYYIASRSHDQTHAARSLMTSEGHWKLLLIYCWSFWCHRISWVVRPSHFAMAFLQLPQLFPANK